MCAQRERSRSRDYTRPNPPAATEAARRPAAQGRRPNHLPSTDVHVARAQESLYGRFLNSATRADRLVEEVQQLRQDLHEMQRICRLLMQACRHRGEMPQDAITADIRDGGRGRADLWRDSELFWHTFGRRLPGGVPEGLPFQGFDVHGVPAWVPAPPPPLP